MIDKEEIKAWLTSLANEDYVAADKQFPNVVKTALNTVINNKKPTVVERLNAEAETIAIQASELTKTPVNSEEPKK